MTFPFFKTILSYTAHGVSEKFFPVNQNLLNLYQNNFIPQRSPVTLHIYEPDQKILEGELQNDSSQGTL